MKIGVIDVGGGYRGIYAAGILDYCMEHNVKFDTGIGISAGSANIISYAAGQKGRNYHFFAEYGLRKEYASMKNFISNRNYVNLDYVYSTLSNSGGENPLDYDSFTANPMDFLVVATDALTGEPVYFDKNDIQRNNYTILKASCSIPYVCQPCEINGNLYYDGALSDPIPLSKGFELGCDYFVLILTKPENEVRASDKDIILSKLIQRKYPKAAEKLKNRAKLYNDSLHSAQEYAKEGKILIVSPDDTCGVDTLTKDYKKLNNLYDKGYKDGQKILDFIRNVKEGNSNE